MLSLQHSTDEFANKNKQKHRNDTYDTHDTEDTQDNIACDDVPCPNKGCNEKMKRKYFKNHYENTCLYTLKECKYCHKQDILNKDMFSHWANACFLNEKRFKFIKQISETLQGHILMAIDTHNKNKKIIIKSANRYLVNQCLSKHNHKIAENFLGERTITKKLSQYHHNGIVEWIQSWNDSNCYFYAMQMYKISLFDYIKYNFKPNNLEWIRKIQIILRSLCKTVDWLHNKQYCHLDLSLENAMIDPQTLNVTIIDLGTAKKFKKNNFKCYGMVGKINYMSPEVYSNCMYFDARLADVYSLGCMLFTMLFGRRPYNNQAPTTHNLKNFAKMLEKYYGEYGMNTRCSLYKSGLDLLKRIFRFQSTRIDLQNVLIHPFINNDNGRNVHVAIADRLIYGDILDQVMGSNNCDIKDINFTRELLEFISECFEMERLNKIEPQRLINLYEMIYKLYMNKIISFNEINLYFGHLLKAKYWKKSVNIPLFISKYVAFCTCWCLKDKFIETELWNECEFVFYYEKKKNRFNNIITMIGELFKYDLISWNVIFYQFVKKLLFTKTLFDICAGFKLLKIISLHSNNYNKYNQEINILINNLLRNCNGKIKYKVLLLKMIKNYWNTIQKDNYALPPGLVYHK